MAGDVEDFLRKLIEKQMGQQQPQRPAPQQRQPPQQRPGAPQQQQQRRPVPQRLQAEIIDEVVEVIDAESIRRESVAQHVSHHLDSSEFQSRSGRLGAGVREEEAALQSHLKDTFGTGPKGKLAKSSDAASDGGANDNDHAATTAAAALVTGPSIASQVLKMIATPNDLRCAFILGDILRRPDFDNLSR